MTSWLLIHYKLPNKPSALRVYIWRKLRRLGAVFLNNAICVLPDTPRTAENLQWLAAEIQEMRGEVNLWRSSLVLGPTEEELIDRFRKQVDLEYRGLLKRLGQKNRDLAKLSQEYQQVIGRDYFQSDLGKQ